MQGPPYSSKTSFLETASGGTVGIGVAGGGEVTGAGDGVGGGK